MHVRHADATNWNGSGAFYNAVNQGAVNAMALTGLQQLTGQGTWSQIWQALFSSVQPGGYREGQVIAIKVNFNNSGRDGNGCDTHNNLIDALPHPVLALIQGLAAAGVRAQDIVVYDATVSGSQFPSYFRNPITASFAQVRFVGSSECLGVIAASHGKHPSLTVSFSDPAGALSDRLLADVLYDATYLINMPILKRHGISPVTLAFKNHLGSLNAIVRSGQDDMHRWISPSDSLYGAGYSPLVDINRNSHIRDKTILIAADGVYGAFGAAMQAVVSWNIFGGAANSLLFSVDPVAVDCVMVDLLRAAGQASKNDAYDYLFCAAEAGLGICEGSRSDPGGDPLSTPFGSGYHDITYSRLDL